jgi:Major Facilitator Superfamily
MNRLCSLILPPGAIFEPLGAEARAQVDVDLAERPFAGVDERVRLVGVHDEDVARARLVPLSVKREVRLSLLDDDHLGVGMPVQRGAAPRLCLDKEDRDAEPVLGPDEFVGDLAPGQLVASDDRHSSSSRLGKCNVMYRIGTNSYGQVFLVSHASISLARPACPEPPTATLALLAFAMLTTSLDQYIVLVALPSIGRDLGFSAQTLQWVISANAVTSAGFLLLGGRAADLLGRRRIFVTGLALYAGASLTGGLAPTPEFLLGARAVQGLGGALVFPATLSLVNTTFAEGGERNRALAVWGGAGAAGLVVGVLLGGSASRRA